MRRDRMDIEGGFGVQYMLSYNAHELIGSCFTTRFTITNYYDESRPMRLTAVDGDYWTRWTIEDTDGTMLLSIPGDIILEHVLVIARSAGKLQVRKGE